MKNDENLAAVLNMIPKVETRWCEFHQLFHGVYYICDSYSVELREEIKSHEILFLENLRKELVR